MHVGDGMKGTQSVECAYLAGSIQDNLPIGRSWATMIMSTMKGDGEVRTGMPFPLIGGAIVLIG